MLQKYVAGTPFQKRFIDENFISIPFCPSDLEDRRIPGKFPLETLRHDLYARVLGRDSGAHA